LMDHPGALDRLRQLRGSVIDVLDECVNEGARGMLQQYLSPAGSNIVREIVARGRAQTTARFESTAGGFDLIAQEKIGRELKGIEQAIQNRALNLIREAHKASPGLRALRELRLQAELELAQDYRAAASILLVDAVPLRALGLTLEEQPLGKQDVGDDGGLTAESRRAPYLKRIFGVARRHGSHEVHVSWQSTAGAAEPVLRILNLDGPFSLQLAKDLTVPCEALPMRGSPLRIRVLEHLVTPTSDMRLQVEALASLKEELAILLELIEPRGLEDGRSVADSLAGGHYSLQVGTEETQLTGITNAQEFLSSLS
jgi:hypothetical protein